MNSAAFIAWLRAGKHGVRGVVTSARVTALGGKTNVVTTSYTHDSNVAHTCLFRALSRLRVIAWYLDRENGWAEWLRVRGVYVEKDTPTDICLYSLYFSHVSDHWHLSIFRVA